MASVSPCRNQMLMNERLLDMCNVASPSLLFFLTVHLTFCLLYHPRTNTVGYERNNDPPTSCLKSLQMSLRVTEVATCLMVGGFFIYKLFQLYLKALPQFDNSSWRTFVFLICISWKQSLSNQLKEQFLYSFFLFVCTI